MTPQDSQDPSDELLTLISAICDDHTTEQQRDRLSKLLVLDRAARRTYLKYMHAEAFCYRLHGAAGVSIDPYGQSPFGVASADGGDRISLDSDLAATSMHDACILPAIRDIQENDDDGVQVESISIARTPPREVRPARSWWGWRGLALRWPAAAAILLAAGLLIWVMSMRQREQAVGPVAGADHRADNLPGNSQGDLTLVSADHAMWEGVTSAPSPGEKLPAGALTLADGSAILRTSLGATVIVCGPMKFEMTSPTNLSLLKGKLVADIPHEVKNFVVQTPNAKIVDLGTEFGVIVDDTGHSQIDVLEGKVSIGADTIGASPQILEAGSACSVGGSGQCTPVPFEARRFEFAARPDGSSPYDRWLSYGRVLRHEPALVAYYTFDKDAAQPAVLVNSASTGGASNGTIVNARWSDGRFPGKSSLYFPGKDEHVKVNIPGNFHNLTMWAWVQTEAADHPQTAIFATDEFLNPGKIHWNLMSDGSISFGIKQRYSSTTDPRALFPTNPRVVRYPSGGWIFLAGVLDDSKVRFYRDGLAQGPTSIRDPKNCPANLRLGASEIGNWAGAAPKSGGLRNFHGWLGELGILSRAMSEAEIKRLYDASKP